MSYYYPSDKGVMPEAGEKPIFGVHRLPRPDRSCPAWRGESGAMAAPYKAHWRWLRKHKANPAAEMERLMATFEAEESAEIAA